VSQKLSVFGQWIRHRVRESDDWTAINCEADNFGREIIVRIVVRVNLDSVPLGFLVTYWQEMREDCDDLRLAHWWAIRILFEINILSHLLLDSRLCAVVEQMEQSCDDENRSSQSKRPWTGTVVSYYLEKRP
jgi:hypothetical protein